MKITIRRNTGMLVCPMCDERVSRLDTTWIFGYSTYKDLSNKSNVVRCLDRVCNGCFNSLVALNDFEVQCVSCGRFHGLAGDRGGLLRIDGSPAYLCGRCTSLYHDDSPDFKFDYQAQCDQCGRFFMLKDINRLKPSFDDYDYYLCNRCRFQNIEALRQMREAGSLGGDE